MPKKSPRNAKPERNRSIYGIYKSRPDLTLEDIGKQFGISRARVFQIVLVEIAKAEREEQRAKYISLSG